MELYLVVIWSVFVNVFIKSLCGAIHNVILPEKDFDENLKIVLYIVTAIITSSLISWLYNSTFIKKILHILGKKTFGNDAFKDVVDYNKKTLMMVYLKESKVMYGGIFKLKDEKGSDSYITLIQYCLLEKDSNTLIRDFRKEKASVVINLRDVERIEIIYEDDSKVWKWLNQDNIMQGNVIEREERETEVKESEQYKKEKSGSQREIEKKSKKKNKKG